jgi:hypothetical protein
VPVVDIIFNSIILIKPLFDSFLIINKIFFYLRQYQRLYLRLDKQKRQIRGIFCDIQMSKLRGKKEEKNI